jgi:hypothetical protein
MATIANNIARIHASLPGLRTDPQDPPTSPNQQMHFPRPVPSLLTAASFFLPKEPEDAQLTGGTRSLDRRLLALNLGRPFAKAKAVRSATTPQRMATPKRSTAA